jgi:hypothetical protein
MSIFRRSITRGELVFITMPAFIGETQEASKAPELSSSTMQSLQAPVGAR